MHVSTLIADDDDDDDVVQLITSTFVRRVQFTRNPADTNFLNKQMNNDHVQRVHIRSLNKRRKSIINFNFNFTFKPLFCLWSILQKNNNTFAFMLLVCVY